MAIDDNINDKEQQEEDTDNQKTGGRDIDTQRRWEPHDLGGKEKAINIINDSTYDQMFTIEVTTSKDA